MNKLVIGREGRAVHVALANARAAARVWAETPLAARVGVLRQVRRLIARDSVVLAATVARTSAETLVAEVLPLAEAARFAARAAHRALCVRPAPGGRPLWLMGVSATIRREPLGVVLVLAPSNYPLFLPGAQVLQALVAGNAVCAKPAPGCGAPLLALAALLAEAGLPAGVLQILGDSAETGRAASRAGFDHVVLTGSAETGTQVLTETARTLTSATVELSGSDAVFVLPGADVSLVARCLAYGLRLNGGATCIAPRRVFVPHATAPALERALLESVKAVPAVVVPPEVTAKLHRLVADAVAAGARLCRPAGPGLPTVLADADPAMELLQTDVFAPWLALIPVADPEAALDMAAVCPFALGASVFGPEQPAVAFAGRVRAGSVCVNDLIVPTADPRLPFGGRGRSGFGVTRGVEGLLAMTAPKTVSVRRGWFRPHLAAPAPGDAARFAQMVALLHGGWRERQAALRGLVARR